MEIITGCIIGIAIVFAILDSIYLWFLRLGDRIGRCDDST